jgi:hypothetical protein
VARYRLFALNAQAGMPDWEGVMTADVSGTGRSAGDGSGASASIA